MSLALRINPGTPVNGVHAEIGYDSAKLQLVSVGEAGSAFPEVAEQNSETNPITLTRTTTDGSSVSGDALIVTLRFRALTGSGNSVVTVTGNAAQGTSPTDPSTQGATISFVSPPAQSPGTPVRPSPQTPSTPSPQSPTPQQPGATPTTPPAAEPTPNQPTSNDIQHPTPQIAWRRFWWAGAVMGGLFFLVAGTFWLMRRRSNAADLAAQHPIDTTWATTAGPAKPRDAAVNELLQRTPGIGTPNPGSVITPKDTDAKK